MDAPAAVAPKKSGPLRWILLGCGALTILGILGMGGCAGVLYLVYKSTDPVAAIGADYLRQSPDLKSALGKDNFSVKRNAFGWNVNVANDSGNARITYSIRQGQDGELGEAVVWLLRSGGKWEAVGARVTRPAGEPIRIGKPPSSFHLPDWD